jgi:hypothetical protein
MAIKTEPTSTIEKSKYLNQMDEVYGTIYSLISPELPFTYPPIKPPMKPGPPWREFLENRTS